MSEGTASRPPPARRPPPTVSPARLAILAAGLGAFLWSLTLAASYPPWTWPDERAHTGYASELAHLRLPDLDTPIRRLDRAPDLDTTMDLYAVDNYVWVSNHPPGGYVLAVPGTWVAHRTGRGELVILSLRAANALGAALAVGLTALVARELTASRRAAVLAAGFTAAAPHLLGVSSRGMTDGVSLAATLFAVWAAIRIARRGVDRPTVVLAALALAACGLTRIAALATGLVVLGLALLADAARHRRVPWGAALAIGAPAALSSGWFYVRNTILYGDPAASAELLERFNRTSRSSVAGVLTTWSGSKQRGFPGGWDEVVPKVLTTFHGEPSAPWVRPHPPAPEPAATLVLLAVAAGGLLLVVRFVVARAQGRSLAGAGPLGWGLLAVAAAIRFVTTAQHIAGGGLAHPRYLLLLIPVSACVVAAALDVAGRRWRAVRVAAIALLSAWIGWSALASWDLSPHPFGELLPSDRLGPAVVGTVLTIGAAVVMVAYVGLAARVVVGDGPEPAPERRADRGTVRACSSAPGTTDPR